MDWFLNDEDFRHESIKPVSLKGGNLKFCFIVSLNVQKRLVIQRQPPKMLFEISQNGLENASGLQLN